jgi:hypothetical protein
MASRPQAGAGTEPQEPPPPRGYIFQALSTIWETLRALAQAAIRTADDSRPQHAQHQRPPPLIVDPAAARDAPPPPAAATAPPARPPPLCARGGAAAPPRHHHGALVGLAEGLERAVLAEAPPGAREAVAAAAEEMAAGRERGGDPFRRALVSA